LRLTKQRQIILEVLKKHSDHPGADKIYHEVRKVLPHISLGTVYRNLELLSETGMIKKLGFVNDQKRFDPNPRPHCHFRCVECGNIEDIPFDINTKELDRNIPWVREREILGCNLWYYGLCAACASKGVRGMRKV